MTASTTRLVTKAQAYQQLHAAIDKAMAQGRATPCRLSSSYDTVTEHDAEELVHRCRTQCPVLDQCRALAVLLPRSERVGAVLAGQYVPIPSWKVVYERLRDAIEVGEYRAGDRLPTAHEIRRDHGCSSSTAGRALAELAEQGLAVADAGQMGQWLVVDWGVTFQPDDSDELDCVVAA
ncbi:MAG TPA: winged helix-turn-helix domain-containing protein [Kribbellaceae bacterium]